MVNSRTELWVMDGKEQLVCKPFFSFIMFFCLLTFQFDCTNTLNDQRLEKVTVQVEPSDSYEVLCCIPVPSLTYNQPGICYTLVRLPDDDSSAGTNPKKGRDTYMIKNALPVELLNVWTHVSGSRIWFFSRIKCNASDEVFIVT